MDWVFGMERKFEKKKKGTCKESNRKEATIVFFFFLKFVMVLQNMDNRKAFVWQAKLYFLYIRNYMYGSFPTML